MRPKLGVTGCGRGCTVPKEGEGCIRLLFAILAATHAVALSGTAYCQGTITASGQAPFVGEVANNMWPLGTHLVVSPAVWGRTRFVVEDRIGAGSQLDFYTPDCQTAIVFGRRVERVQVVK
jgi:3D (Asp-Asp-Asp) domain-containing protein